MSDREPRRVLGSGRLAPCARKDALLPSSRAAARPRAERGISAPPSGVPAARIPLLALVLALALGCRGGGDVELVPVPQPDLAAAEPQVREQVAGARRELDELLARPGVEPEEKAQAFADLGLLYLTYDFVEAAEASLRNAVALAPDDFRWSYLLGYLYKVQGRSAEGAELLARATELEPDYQPALVRLGQLRLEAGDADAAEPLFHRALELDPESAAAHEGLGRVAEARGDARAAIPHYEKALELQPGASSLHYLLGQAYRRAGDLDRATFHLSRRGDAPVRVADPLLRPIGELARSAQFYLVQGSEAVGDGRYEAAVASYARALELDPKSFVARKGLAFSLEQLGDFEAAEDRIREALAVTDDPAETAEAEAILGSLLATGGADREAEAHLRRSLELTGDRPGVRLKLADLLVRTGRLAEAVAEYDRLLAATPDAEAAPLLVRRGSVYVNLGRRAEALADFRRALAQRPDDAGLHLRYAEALEYFGEREAAARERETARRLTGEGEDRMALLAGEGRLAAARGDRETAVERYRAALAIDPAHAGVRFALAAVLAQSGRHEEAVAEFHRVVEAQPEHPAARRGEIASLVLAGRFGEARVRLNEAMSRFTRDKELALTQARLLAASPDPRVRDPALAVQIAERVSRVYSDLPSRDTLAMAYAAAGRTREAAAAQEEALRMAEASGNPALATAMREKLAAYREGRPWQVASPAELLVLGPVG